ncbi:hypothetical protein NS14008_11585 [Nocardia seriolae]|nr:hypothetical protein NS14008_11585 [Nocardia seriolae]PSK26611.1 hypothetical protein C6575_36345 [Nocardia seriolae]
MLVGCSAAVMLRARWMDDQPVEITIPQRARPPKGVLVYRDSIPEKEICWIDGLRCTTPARTAFDIGRRVNGDMGVAFLDSLFRATGLNVGDVRSVIRDHPGARNCRHLLRLLPHVDAGAESIQETHTRLLLCRAGLPRPETQIEIRLNGTIIARLDMGWPDWKVGVEYDGAHHWTNPTQRTRDLTRYNKLPALGWTIIRTNATLLHSNPEDFLSSTFTALKAHGYSPSGTKLG